MKQRKSEINWKLVVRVACLMLLDVMLLYLACLLALLSRFDLSIHTLMRDSGFLPALHAAFPWMAIGMITLFIPLKLYSSLWEFAGVEELLHILCACFLFAAATLLLILFGVLDLPRSFPVLAGLYLVALLSASRFSYRLIRTILHRSGSEKRKKRTMLIGAGSAGMLVLREFQTSENSQNNVVCVIDDDRDKLGKYIRNVKIAGTRDDIVALAQSRRIEVPAAARFSCWIWASRSALTIWPATSSVFPALSRTWISRSAIPACAPVRSSMKRCSCRKRGFAPRRTI